jgi:RHS repeat-associated protein
VNLQWLVADQLGTPRMVFDKTGALANVKRHDYLPFGEELYASVGLRSTTQGYTAPGYSPVDKVRQKFTQKERDIETGLDYFGARYYSSTQGRFTSIDPENYQAMLDLTDPQSWNAYSYVNNNPLGRVDPDGKGFFSKLKNWLAYNVWGEEEDVKKEEQKRRDMMLRMQSENGGELIIQNFAGEWVRVDPATMNRANVWLWSGQIYSSPGSRNLTAEEAANVLDVGAMKRLEYEASPKHGSTTRGNVSAAPKRGQNALDNSVQVKGTSTRRVGVDYQNREFVVFDETRAGKFHGHARSWQQLTQEMKNALVKSGMASRSGKIN